MTTTPARPIGLPDPGHCEYAAFISYRHVEPDQSAARWLIKAVETYRIPREIRRRYGAPAKVGRIFRDEDELPSDPDLPQSLRNAIDSSRMLVAVCSPRLKESNWCRSEIRRFRELDRPVLALLVAGDPSRPGTADDPFTPEIRVRLHRVIVADGSWSFIEEPAEPIAADIRPRTDTSVRKQRLQAKLRIVASLLGIRYDDLYQRDRRRRRQRSMVVCAIVFGVLSTLTWSLTRADAEGVRRAFAELVERTNNLPMGTRAEMETAALIAAHAYAADVGLAKEASLPGIDGALRRALDKLVSLDNTIEWSLSTRPGDGQGVPESLSGLIRGHGVPSIAIHPVDGCVYFFGPLSVTLEQWRFRGEVRSKQVGPGLLVADSSPLSIRFSSGGRGFLLSRGTLLVSTEDGKDWTAGEFWRANLSWKPACFAIDPSVRQGHFRAVCANENGDWAEVSDGAAEPAPLRKLELNPTSLEISRDGLQVAAIGKGGRLTLARGDGFDDRLVVVGHGPEIRAVRFNHRSSQIICGDTDGNVTFWMIGPSGASKSRVISSTGRRQVRSLDVAPDGETLAVGYADPGDAIVNPGADYGAQEMSRGGGSVLLFDLSKTQLTDVPVAMPGSFGGVQSLAFDTSGGLLAAGCEDGSVHIWVVGVQRLIDITGKSVSRELTEDEWRQVAGRRLPYKRVFQGLK